MRYWKETSITTAIVKKAVKIKDEHGNVHTVLPGATALLSGDYIENQDNEPCFAFGEHLHLLVLLSEAQSNPESFQLGWTHGFPVDAIPQDILPWKTHRN